MFSRIKKVLKVYGALKTKQVLSLAFLISFVLATVAELNNPNGNYIGDVKGMLFNYFPMIFLNIAPVMFVFRLGFLKKVKANPLNAVGMILYFLLFLPLFLGIQTWGGARQIDRTSFFYIGITTLNIIAILIGHVVLAKYVFLDIILKRRKPTGKDTIIVFMTYVSMGVSFGFIYALITTISSEPAFNNMNLEMAAELGNIKLYFRHIYYSFITLTSVGFGDIYPLTWQAQMFTVMESILGVFLLSFSLGIILSAEAEEHTVKQDEEEKFKKELLDDIEKLIDRKLGNKVEDKIEDKK